MKRDWHWLHLASTLRSPKCLLREVGVRGTSAARTDDSKKWKYIPSSWIRRIFIVKMAKCLQIHIYRFSAIPSSVQSLSCVRLLATPWTAACQASLSITNSRSLLKLMSIELVMPSNHLILCHPLLLPSSIFPASGSFKMSQFFVSGGQSIGVSASASVFPMNTQDWFPLGWT